MIVGQQPLSLPLQMFMVAKISSVNVIDIPHLDQALLLWQHPSKKHTSGKDTSEASQLPREDFARTELALPKATAAGMALVRCDTVETGFYGP